MKDLALKHYLHDRGHLKQSDLYQLAYECLRRAPEEQIRGETPSR